jgi:hypothetical protein
MSRGMYPVMLWHDLCLQMEMMKQVLHQGVSAATKLMLASQTCLARPL